MKSICIKTNNNQIINYLLENFEDLNTCDTYITVKNFAHFTNIILHCKSDSTIFINLVSNIITEAIILFFEKSLVKTSINSNYFYFSSLERNEIANYSTEILNDYENVDFKYNYINNEIYNFLSNHHSLYLKGFIDFRLPEYLSFINEKIDLAVNKFLIDKEYLEFVNILRLYIKSESLDSNIEHLHLIYKNKNSIIINDNKEIVSCNDNISKVKYISDISFSSNDLALNTLLNLLPKKITVHLIDSYPDEFINTLELIFQDKITICEDCDICNMYRYKKIKL